MAALVDRLGVSYAVFRTFCFCTQREEIFRVPLYRSRTVFEILRGVKAFLNLEVGLTRGVVSDFGRDSGNDSQAEKLKEIQRRLSEKTRSLRELRKQAASKDRELARLKKEATSSSGYRLGPDNLIWIFGMGRSGNTWLSSMMGSLSGHTIWSEPCIGQLFGTYYYDPKRDKQRKSSKFVLGDPVREIWLRAIRLFVLENVNDRFPDASIRHLVIKEQPGSEGAPLLMEALPESRMILLIRDPRDVVASNLDATSEGGWSYHRRKLDKARATRRDDGTDLKQASRLAEDYSKKVGKAKEAYEAHQGPKALIKYEQLREDTLGTMQRLYSSLGIEISEHEMARVVKEHSWENIPEENKGEGKFYRKGTPGSWREDLRAEEVRIVERTTAPLLKAFYGD
jgi:hypothetical protein